MHQPFAVLAEWVRDGRLRTRQREALGPKATPSEVAVPPAEPVSDEELFSRAVGDVRPLSSRGGVVEPSARPPIRGDREDDDGLPEIKVLADLCRTGEIDLHARREYVEAWVAPEGRLYIGALHEGRFAIQAHLDLHGLTLDAGRDALDVFIRNSVRAGYRAVRVIHGRGRHSPDGRSPMKAHVQRWLRERRMARFVLAYTSARVVDGGGGAVYVLLRGRDEDLRF